MKGFILFEISGGSDEMVVKFLFSVCFIAITAGKFFFYYLNAIQ